MSQMVVDITNTLYSSQVSQHSSPSAIIICSHGYNANNEEVETAILLVLPMPRNLKFKIWYDDGVRIYAPRTFTRNTRNHITHTHATRRWYEYRYRSLYLHRGYWSTASSPQLCNCIEYLERVLNSKFITFIKLFAIPHYSEVC